MSEEMRKMLTIDLRRLTPDALPLAVPALVAAYARNL